MEMAKIELKRANIAIFSLNYFIQGINQSMFTTIIPIYLLQLMGTVNAGEIASIMSLVLLPFGVKFIYGILSDKIGLRKLGRRKPWIIGPSIVSGLIWIFLTLLLTPGNAMTLIIILGILISISVAMADTAIDGLILDLYPKERLGRVQGICWGFRSIGIIAGGPILVIFILLSGGIIDYIFIGLGIAMMVFSFLILIVKETVKKIEVNVVDNLKIIFGKSKNWKVFIFSLFISISDGVVFVIVPLFILVQWGLVSAAGATIVPLQIDLYAPQALIAAIIALGVIAGAVVGGRTSDLQSRKRSIYLSLLLTTGSFLLFLIPMIWPVLMIFAFLLGGSSGWKNSAFSAVIGQESQLYPEMDSTFYATCNSFTNLGTAIGLEITSVLFVSLIGLPTFAIYAVIFLVMVILININLIAFKTLDPKEYEINYEKES